MVYNSGFDLDHTLFHFYNFSYQLEELKDTKKKSNQMVIMPYNTENFVGHHDH